MKKLKRTKAVAKTAGRGLAELTTIPTIMRNAAFLWRFRPRLPREEVIEMPFEKRFAEIEAQQERTTIVRRSAINFWVCIALSVLLAAAALVMVVVSEAKDLGIWMVALLIGAIAFIARAIQPGMVNMQMRLARPITPMEYLKDPVPRLAVDELQEEDDPADPRSGPAPPDERNQGKSEKGSSKHGNLLP